MTAWGDLRVAAEAIGVAKVKIEAAATVLERIGLGGERTRAELLRELAALLEICREGCERDAIALLRAEGVGQD